MDDDGTVPILEWLDDLSSKVQAKCLLGIGGLPMIKAHRRSKPTSDAVEILQRRYFRGQPARIAELEEERANAEVGRAIHSLRTEAGLSQRELAALVGTTASVICRLEDADYTGHSLAMLRRIAAALKKRVEIRFVPAGKRA
jgi:ribosome-binding protein aMBF1 (putative translation factor)